MQPLIEKILRSCCTCAKKISNNDQTYHCVSRNCVLHLEPICTGLSSVAINGIKELVANVLLLGNKFIETGKEERLLGSAMAKKVEESFQCLDLDRKLQRIEQKLTRLDEDRIQVSVNEAMQKMERNYADVATNSATASSNEMSDGGKGKSSKISDRTFQSRFRVQRIPEDPEMSPNENFVPSNKKLKDVLNSLGVSRKLSNCDDWENLIKIVANQERFW